MKAADQREKYMIKIYVHTFGSIVSEQKTFKQKCFKQKSETKEGSSLDIRSANDEIYNQPNSYQDQ